MGKDKSHKKDKEHKEKDKDRKHKRKSLGEDAVVTEKEDSPVAAAASSSVSPPPPPMNADSKVSKKSKKDKKDKKDKEKRKSKKKSTSPAVADALLEALADKDVIVGKKDEEDDLMQMDIDTEGKIKGGTAEGVKLVKKGQVVTGALVPFAKPLAEGKLAKKVLKTVKKAAKVKSLKRGVKEVQKSLRKSPMAKPSNKGEASSTPLLVLAGDISPEDVISHLPVLAEDHGVPYVFVTSRAELGAAGATKRPTSVVMISPPGSTGAGKKRKPKAGEDEKEALKKIKEEEEEFKSAFTDLVKEVEGVTRALRV